MARGGARSGAGRKPGSTAKATKERLAEIAGTGETPVEYMLRVMRDSNADEKRRDAMAVSSAPYLHPKLASTEVTGKDGGPVKVTITGDDIGLL